jgi:hypothetical protein
LLLYLLLGKSYQCQLKRKLGGSYSADLDPSDEYSYFCRETNFLEFLAVSVVAILICILALR